MVMPIKVGAAFQLMYLLFFNLGFAAVINLEMPRGLTPWLATLAEMVSGVSTVETLFQAHW